MKGEMVATELSDLCSIRYIFGNGPIKISWKPYKQKRSLPQNALMWQWLTKLASKFSNGMESYSKEDMHDLMRHKFLGYETVTIGNTELKDRLISTTSLDTGAMFEYMQKVDAWAVAHGVFLPRPQDCEYEQLLREAA